MDQALTPWADALAEEIRTSYPSVRLELGLDPGPYLVLFWITLPASERGKGIGTRVLEHIITEADRRGVPVTLSPSANFGGDLERLHTFYRRLGFITNASRGEIGSPRESLVRPLRAPAAVDDSQ
ncbi:GNAT family N-acetyltransferase [Streptomyces toxytricini]|uniref:GNAT family N-acetyltransferase n=1 Tax=Streptomyces toxytricini TaxID=67369 RepID=UPI0034370F99